MEDLIFYGKQVMETLCECGGGGIPRQEHFQHIPQTAIWEPQLGSEESFFNRSNDSIWDGQRSNNWME
jgi:hypothetical protein